MYSYEKGGYTAKKHQKMRPSKRRKLNKEMKYDTTIILEPRSDIKITLEDGRKVGKFIFCVKKYYIKF